MSWDSMSRELSAQVPIPDPFARILINRAWQDIQGSWLWSFLYGDAVIPTASPVSAGTVTVTLGQATVVGDATAGAAWNAMGLVVPITSRQFRVGQGMIYNIIAFDGANTITLDRLYVDSASAAGVGYQIFQCYFNAPTLDFVWWESVKDPISGYAFNTTMAREYADMVDPQRFQSGWSQSVIPYIINPQAGNFNGFPMFEIWPAPINGTPLLGTYFRDGMPFVNPGDTVTNPLGEDIVIQLAKVYAYEWAQANPDKCPKADYRYLYTQAKKMYDNDGKGGSMLDRYILRDMQFSARGRIEVVDSNYLNALPWVSQKAGLQYAP